MSPSLAAFTAFWIVLYFSLGPTFRVAADAKLVNNRKIIRAIAIRFKIQTLHFFKLECYGVIKEYLILELLLNTSSTLINQRALKPQYRNGGIGTNSGNV